MKQRECNIVEELEIVVQPNIMLEYSKDSIADLGNLIILELIKKQDKEDLNLETDDKTIVGAINEINTSNQTLKLDISQESKDRIQDIQTIQNTKQDKEDPSLVTSDNTIVGAINELWGNIEHKESEIYNRITVLQKQIDGETSTWFFGGVPSQDTAPANEWTDDTLKKGHAGDVYINTLPLEADLTAINANGMPLWFESGSLDVDSDDYFESQRIDNSMYSRTRVLLKTKDEKVTINFSEELVCNVVYYKKDGKVNKNLSTSTTIPTSSITLHSRDVLGFTEYFALVIEKIPRLLSTILKDIVCDHTFTNIYAGKAWRWVEKDSHNYDYHWCPIADSDAVKALAASNENKKSIQENSEAIESLGEEVAALQEQIGSAGEITPVFTDVSLFATTTKRSNRHDDVFVKAPAGMLKETDQVIFARYISNKTRPRLDGMTDKSIPRSVYRGWIKPARGGKHNSQLHIPDDMLKLIYSTTIDGYDQFELRVDPDSDDEPLLFYLWEYASVSEDGHRYPRVKDKKLGIKIVRDGKTIVDYLPFTVKVDNSGCVHFGRL